jgi:hypothetical protein
MYGCSKAGSIASSSSSSADVEPDERVTERPEASETDSSSSIDTSDVVEDLGYRVNMTVYYVICHKANL